MFPPLDATVAPARRPSAPPARLLPEIVYQAPRCTTLAQGSHANVAGRVLQWMGARGPLLLVATLAAGIAWPAAADAARHMLPVSAFLLTFGSFLTAILSRPEPDLSCGRTLLTLIWAGLGVPLAAALALVFVPLPSTLKFCVLVSSLAPPIGSAAAIAALLGLRPRLALIGSVALTLGAPASVPGLTRLFNTGMAFDGTALVTRLIVIIACSALLAALAWRFRARTASTVPGPRAAAGIAVSGLMVVALVAAGSGRAHWIAAPHEFERLLAIAVLANLGACILGAALFARLGSAAALTVGLLSGNRNITLVWAAASASLPATADAYFIASVIPILSLPLVLKLAIGTWGRVFGK